MNLLFIYNMLVVKGSILGVDAVDHRFVEGIWRVAHLADVLVSSLDWKYSLLS
jgi:hypothetical protein